MLTFIVHKGMWKPPLMFAFNFATKSLETTATSWCFCIRNTK